MKTTDKIDFIGIGASRSGTTWISQCLSEHPEICFSNKKETHFFNRDHLFRKGLGFYASFFDCGNEKIKGEFTPGYLDSPKSARKIYESFPDAKLLVCLRNPIERAYSQYFYKRAQETESAENFEEAVFDESNNYMRRGRYYTNLKPFLELFPEKNINISIYKDIKKDPVNFIQKIYDFLGVDPGFIPASAKKYINTSKVNRKLVYIPYMNQFINLFKKHHNNKLITLIRTPLKKLGVIKLLHFIRIKNKKKLGKSREEKPEMNRKTRQKLYDYYKDDINNLKKLLNRNLEGWS